MTRNNNTTQEQNSTELRELNAQPPDPEYIRRDRFQDRMHEVRQIGQISRLTSKLQTETIAEIIDNAIHQQTAQPCEYDEETRTLSVMNYGADAVKPAHVVQALDLETWTGVYEVGRIPKEDTDEIIIKLW